MRNWCFKKKGENLGYEVFIIPGSTFLKKIIEKNKFKAVLGVACYQDLNLGMMKLSNFSCQGVPLSRDGCINTKVDSRAVMEKMGIKLEKNTSISRESPCSTETYRKKTL